MRFKQARSFKKSFRSLSPERQRRVKEKLRLFAETPNYPYHPSLRIKPIKGFKGIFEGHISRELVFTFGQEIDPQNGETIITLRRIGSHDIYGNP